MSKTVLETLEAARNLISDPAKWTKQAYFRDSRGGRVWGFEPSRTDKCCMVGALSLAGGIPPSLTEDTDAYMALKETCGSRGVVYFNDTRTHGEVLAAFDAAIEKARQA